MENLIITILLTSIPILLAGTGELISEKSDDFYFILITITSLFVGSGNVLISELFFIIILLLLFFLKKKDE